jgi:hypothetical protein
LRLDLVLQKAKTDIIVDAVLVHEQYILNGERMAQTPLLILRDAPTANTGLALEACISAISGQFRGFSAAQRFGGSFKGLPDNPLGMTMSTSAHRALELTRWRGGRCRVSRSEITPEMSLAPGLAKPYDWPPWQSWILRRKDTS